MYGKDIKMYITNKSKEDRKINIYYGKWKRIKVKGRATNVVLCEALP